MKLSKIALSLGVSVLLLWSSASMANPIVATFVDIIGQGQDPGDIYLRDEHGPSAGHPGGVFTADQYAWITNQTYDGFANTWTVTITNESSHWMNHTVLALEAAIFNLAPNTWDGTVGANEAYFFGNIAAGASATRVISVTAAPAELLINSLGLNSGDPGSNGSVMHAPEPTSLALLGLAGLAGAFARRRQV